MSTIIHFNNLNNNTATHSSSPSNSPNTDNDKQHNQPLADFQCKFESVDDVDELSLVDDVGCNGAVHMTAGYETVIPMDIVVDTDTKIDIKTEPQDVIASDDAEPTR